MSREPVGLMLTVVQWCLVSLVLVACQSMPARVTAVKVEADGWATGAGSCLTLYEPSVELRWQFRGGSLRHGSLMETFRQELSRRQQDILRSHSSLRVDTAGALDSPSTGALFRRLGLTLTQPSGQAALHQLRLDSAVLPPAAACRYGGVLLFDAWLFEGETRPSRQQLLLAVWSTHEGRLMLLASSEAQARAHRRLASGIDQALRAVLEQLP